MALKEALNFKRERPLEERVAMLAMVRERSAEVSDAGVHRMHEWLVRRVGTFAAEARAIHEELQATIDRLTAPPHFPAVYLGSVDGGSVRVAMDGGGERIVNLNEGVGPLERGECVVLSAERNIVLGKIGRSKTGDLARFERASEGGHAIVNHRSEEVVCEVVNGLALEGLAPGDSILIDPGNRLAIEKVEGRKEGRLPYEAEEVGSLGPQDIAGLDEQLDLLLGALMIGLHHEVAEAYGLGGLTSVLLHGPPGTGKTLMAKVVAAELERRCKRKVRFLSVRPSELRSMWHGETEARIRRLFASIRDLTEESPDLQVVVFFDEGESLGKVRGGSRVHSFMDDHTNALLAELDGFQDLHNVSIVTSTNRIDLLDPALRDRLASIDIAVPRPRMEAARAIFAVHLTAEVPWAAPNTREEAIEAALATLFLSDRNSVVRITFNDGTQRVVKAHELVCGRMIKGISTNARRMAARRDAENGGPAGGIETADVLEAVEDAIDGLRTSLSKENVQSYLGDLPQDLAVVAVEALRPKPRRPDAYLNA